MEAGKEPKDHNDLKNLIWYKVLVSKPDPLYNNLFGQYNVLFHNIECLSQTWPNSNYLPIYLACDYKLTQQMVRADTLTKNCHSNFNHI